MQSGRGRLRLAGLKVISSLGCRCVAVACLHPQKRSPTRLAFQAQAHNGPAAVAVAELGPVRRPPQLEFAWPRRPAGLWIAVLQPRTGSTGPSDSVPAGVGSERAVGCKRASERWTGVLCVHIWNPFPQSLPLWCNLYPNVRLHVPWFFLLSFNQAPPTGILSESAHAHSARALTHN